MDTESMAYVKGVKRSIFTIAVLMGFGAFMYLDFTFDLNVIGTTIAWLSSFGK